MEAEATKNVQNPPWPRCECGHRRRGHIHKGKTGKCMWHRPNKETGKMEWCDCKEYWVLEQKRVEELSHVPEHSAV